MKTPSINMTKMAALVSMAVLQIGAAWAQEATVPAADKNSLNFDTVVVTGTPIGRSKMKSSVSISTMDNEQIQMAAPTSSAEVLRSIPGIHAESSGGEGNANITVRGLPISAGGARYVSFQEDGLPVLQNGDYGFVTADMFVKVDNSLDRLEVVRGGSSSVLGSNAPGGIVNFITKTGEVKGGSIGLSKGTGNQTRYDLDYGTPLSDTTRIFVGGFYRTGDGSRDGGIKNVEDGGQIKANITHELGEGSFIRFSVKHLDDRTPLGMQLPVNVTNVNATKANPAYIFADPAYDLLRGSLLSPYWSNIVVRDKSGGLMTKNANEGLTVKEDSLGFEGSFKLAGGWTLNENFRKTSKSGGFAAAMPTNDVFNANPGTIIATGPNAGKAYTGRAVRAASLNATFDDLGSTLNALKLSKTFDLGTAGKLTPLFGWDTNNQKVSKTIGMPHYLISATGNQPVMLTGTDASGNQSDSTGLFPGGGWGGEAMDIDYVMSSPYLSVAYETGALNLDAGVRKDSLKVQGYRNFTSTGALSYVPGTFSAVPSKPVNYDDSYNSYSLGGNYRVTNNLAVFARYSDGATFSLVERGGSTNFDGTEPTDLYIVKQSELGAKWRTGGLNIFATYFQAKVSEGNYDLTTQTASSLKYKSSGLELEAGYHTGGFNINSGLTYTQSEITYEGKVPLVPTTIGNTPHRLPKFQYQITPSYSFGDLNIGGSIIGQTKAFSGGNDKNISYQDGFYVVNLFANYQIDMHTSVYLSANNLLNKVGITEMDFPNRTAARSINGRTAKIGVKYTF